MVVAVVVAMTARTRAGSCFRVCECVFSPYTFQYWTCQSGWVNWRKVCSIEHVSTQGFLLPHLPLVVLAVTVERDKGFSSP